MNTTPVVCELIEAGMFDAPDSNDDLIMVHFNETARAHPSATKYRGDVFSSHTGTLVCPSTGLIEEMDWVEGDPNLIDEPIYQAPPGTILRAFHHNELWYLCSNRKLDADRSRWGTRGQTFAQLFMERIALTHKTLFYRWFPDWADKHLDKNRTYTFLVVHDEWIPTDQHGVYLFHSDSDRSPVLLMEGVRQLEKITSEIAQVNEPAWGYLCRRERRWMRHTSSNYREQMKLQGNTPDSRRRYMELELDSDPALLARFLETRPSVADMKLEDDHAWTTIVQKLLEDESFLGSAIRNRGALMRWSDLAISWLEREEKDSLRLKIQALTWWHTEKTASHFSKFVYQLRLNLNDQQQSLPDCRHGDHRSA